MRGCLAALMCLCCIVGCKSSKPPAKPANITEIFRNDRLKAETFDDEPIEGPELVVVVNGIWQTTSGNKDKSLVFPEQVELICTKAESLCRAETVTLGAMPGLVKIDDISTDEYQIDSWDTHSLHASYGPDAHAKLGSADRCHRHVLTVNFESGATLLTDVPTGEAGCEVFAETNTYRLARGNYYVDTSPGNDEDKPRKSESVESSK